MVQILILAAVAAFLFWRLSLVLGVRTGFEKTIDLKIQDGLKPKQSEKEPSDVMLDDEDISDYVELASDSGQQLKNIKQCEQNFSVNQFVSGAKGAYELILMAYEKGDLSILEEHLAPDVYNDFEKVVTDLRQNGCGKQISC